MYYTWIDADVTRILVAGEGDELRYLLFADGRHVQAGLPADDWIESSDRLREPIRQLQAWLHGDRRTFDLPLAPQGTEFQQRVWKALQDIPFGETVTYREIAEAIGQPTASRAVGLANGRNPISIIIPCHRVIGSSGKLVGYGGGLKIKRWLLDHERKVLGTPNTSSEPMVCV